MSTADVVNTTIVTALSKEMKLDELNTRERRDTHSAIVWNISSNKWTGTNCP